MTITTLFNLGDVLYLITDANEGNLIPVIVEKIFVTVETTVLTVIRYQVSSNEKFHNTTYYENELETYENAKNRAESVLDAQITQLEQDKTEL